MMVSNQLLSTSFLFLLQRYKQHPRILQFHVTSIFGIDMDDLPLMHVKIRLSHISQESTDRWRS